MTKTTPLVGGWCICGEPVVAEEGGECPCAYQGTHLFVLDPEKSRRYPVSPVAALAVAAAMTGHDMVFTARGRKGKG